METEQQAVATIQPPPPPLKPSRVSRISGMVLMGSAFVFFACFGSILIGMAIHTQMYWVLNCLAVGVGISACVALIAALVRVLASVFAESNVRLNELLVSIFLAGSIATIALSFLPKYQDRDEQTFMSLVFIVGSFVMTSIGSAWGWSIARRMKISDGRERMKMLAFGWMLTVGGFSAAWLFFFTIIWMTDRFIMSTQVLSYIVGSLLGSPLLIPAVKIEIQLRRKSAANQAS